jgi:hypothetical protein
MFYLIRRNDSYEFLQRYIPRDYIDSNGHQISFTVLHGPLSLADIVKLPKRPLTVRQFIEKE